MQAIRSTKRTIARVLLAILAAMAVYSASFSLVRKTVILDYLAIDSHGKGTSLAIHYFSKNQILNSFMYYLYYPVHSAIGGDIRTIERAERMEQVPHNTSVYVEDLSALKLREAAGFESN